MGTTQNHGNLLGYGFNAIENALKKIPKKLLPDTVWGEDSQCNVEKNNGKNGDENNDAGSVVISSGDQNNLNNLNNNDLNTNIDNNDENKIIFLQKNSNNFINYSLVSRSYTSNSGICRVKIPVSGSYIIKIVSSGKIPYTSNVVKIAEPMSRTLYVATLQPTILRVVFSVILPVNNEQDNLNGKKNGKNGSRKNSKILENKIKNILENDSKNKIKNNIKKLKIAELKKKSNYTSLNEKACLISISNVVTGERHLVALSCQHSISCDHLNKEEEGEGEGEGERGSEKSLQGMC